MTRRKITITTLAATLLVTVTTLLLGTLGAVNYLAERRRGWAALESDAASKADELAAALALPLWNFDRPQIDRVIESAMRDRDAYSIVVRQADVSAPAGVATHARTRGPQWQVTRADQDPTDRGLLQQERSITADGENLGSVRVYMTGRFVEAELRQSLVQLVWVILVLDLFLSATLYLVMWWAVLRPLKRIEQYASTFADDGQVSPTQGRLPCRELEDLQGSVAKMFGLLRVRLTALQQRAIFDEMFARAVARFATAAADDVRLAIQTALRETAEYIGADHAYVFVLAPDRSSFTAIHEWCAPHVGAGFREYQQVQLGTNPWTESCILSGTIIRTTTLADLPPQVTPQERAYRVSEGAQSILTLPMRGASGIITGCIGLHSHARPYAWTDADVARVKLLGDSIASVVEREQAEAALRESESRFRAIFQRAPIGIAEFDSVSGRLLQVNAKYAQIVDQRVEELLNCRIQDLTHPDDRATGDDELTRLLQERSGQFHLERRYRRRDGREIWVELTCVALELTDGPASDAPPTRYLAIADDITDRRHAQELRVESEKLRTVAALAAGVAHEINNPLAGMVQNAQAILGRLIEDLPANDREAARHGISFADVRAYVEDREIPAMLDSIRDSGRQASRVVRDLLAYSRRDPGTSAIDLGQIVEQTVEIASGDIELKDSLAAISFECQLDNDLPPVLCRSTQIQQVLLNLMRNSVQAMRFNPPERPPRLVLRTIAAAAGAQAGFEVEDNGPGFTPEQRARIFEPFFSSKPMGEGTGLGLFLCNHIVTVNHAGRISVESRTDERTCFRVLLPVASIAAATPAAAEAMAFPQSVSRTS
jgi:PAS domain S-box-containing protein